MTAAQLWIEEQLDHWATCVLNGSLLPPGVVHSPEVVFMAHTRRAARLAREAEERRPRFTRRELALGATQQGIM